MENGHHSSVTVTNTNGNSTKEECEEEEEGGSSAESSSSSALNTSNTVIDIGKSTASIPVALDKTEIHNGDDLVVVDNLIDLDDDGTSATPSYVSPAASVKMLNKSTGSSTLGDESGQDYYEGVGNGIVNGVHRNPQNLLDAPLVPARSSPVHSSILSSGGGKRLTSHLYYGRPGGSSTRSGSRHSSFNSDLESMSASDPGFGGVVSHTELSELTNQMVKIQQQLENQIHNEDKHVRLKQENAVLQERINSLEEQILLSEDRWRQKLADEERKYRELLSRAEREKSLEIDATGLRHQLLEREHSQCTAERQKLLNDLYQLKQKCDRLEETVTDLQQELEASKESHKVAEQRLWKQKEDAEKRLLLAVESCDELRREADRLRKERGYVDGTASELEEELQRLKEEQKRLRDTNNELHAELLQASVEQGRKLLSDGPSLAEEMDRMSKDQIMNALRDQEIVNQKLRSYVDGILLRIIEMHPAILEIKPGEKGLDPC